MKLACVGVGVSVGLGSKERDFRSFPAQKMGREPQKKKKLRAVPPFFKRTKHRKYRLSYLAPQPTETLTAI